VDGQKRILVDQLGTEVANFGQMDAVTGRSLFLSLDAGLQKVAEDASARKPERWSCWTCAMAAYWRCTPALRTIPNLFLNRLSQDMVDRYLPTTSPGRCKQAYPGHLRARLHVQAAGGHCGVEKGVVTPQTVIFCAGKKNFYGRDFRCDKPTGHGACP